jgi:hypothetical protein
MLGLDVSGAPDLQVGCKAAFLERLFAIMLVGYEAKLHSQAGALDGVEAFLSVARHRSFRRAAAELGVTPSAISQAVRALEARIGAVLFIRTTRPPTSSIAPAKRVQRTSDTHRQRRNPHSV